jgi:hypothetical protein
MAVYADQIFLAVRSPSATAVKRRLRFRAIVGKAM